MLRKKPHYPSILAALMLFFLEGSVCVQADETFHRLIITGGLKGAIKECHCPNGQPGGLARRNTIIQRLRAEYPDQSIVIDCGRLTRDGMDSTELTLLTELYLNIPYNFVCCYLIDYHSLTFRGKSLFSHQNHSELPVSDSILQLPFILDYADDSPQIATKPDPKYLVKQLSRQIELSLIGIPAKRLVFNLQTACYDQDFLYNSGDERNWDDNIYAQRETDPYPLAFLPDAMTVNIRNLIESDDFLGPVQDLDASGADFTNLDVAIFGGGGYLVPEVFTVNKIVVAHPDDFGSYVLTLDIWSKDGRAVSRFEWEAIPSESATPDTVFQRRIDEVYDKLNRKKLVR